MSTFENTGSNSIGSIYSLTNSTSLNKKTQEQIDRTANDNNKITEENRILFEKIIPIFKKIYNMVKEIEPRVGKAIGQKNFLKILGNLESSNEITDDIYMLKYKLGNILGIHECSSWQKIIMTMEEQNPNLNWKAKSNDTGTSV